MEALTDRRIERTHGRTTGGSTRRLGGFAALAVAAALLLAAAPAEAQRYDAPRKFGRGLAAMTTCFLELPGNMVKTTRERGLGYGLTLGFAEGLGRLVVRPLVGVYEFVSAPFPVPAGYRPILEPEFPWGYFEYTLLMKPRPWIPDRRDPPGAPAVATHTASRRRGRTDALGRVRPAPNSSRAFRRSGVPRPGR